MTGRARRAGPSCLAALLMGMAAPAAAERGRLRFEDVFSAAGEPASLHYRVAYRAGGGVHHMDVWRDGDRRIKRQTDGAITTFAFHKPGDAGYRMSILDSRKHIHTRVDRTNLYRIGGFTDWFDLAHGLRFPRGPYRLAPGAPPRDAPAPAKPCRWYDLTEGPRTTHICWDGADRIPITIAAADNRILWQVASLERKSIPANMFSIHDRGYVLNDANRDIDPE